MFELEISETQKAAAVEAQIQKPEFYSILTAFFFKVHFGIWNYSKVSDV